MAVFEAEAINALDFFHLVFGSSSEAPESGGSSRGERLRAIAGKSPSPNGLFFKTSPLRELESLYLNLCFLEEISRLVFPRLLTLRHPDLGFSLENIRISFKDHSSPMASRVPLLWNFAVEWIGADVEGVMESDIPRPGEPPFYGLFFMGTIHCAAMMARRYQTPASLAGAVAAMLQNLDRRRPEPGMPSLAVETERVFRSEMTGGGEEWPEPVQTLHRRAFQLGVDLVTDSLEGRCPTLEDFSDSLAELKSAVWRSLFDAGPPSEAVITGKDDALILEILTGVLKRWKTDQAPSEDQDHRKTIDSDPGGDDDEDMARTVVLGPVDGAPPAGPTADDLLETVILGAGRASVSSGDGTGPGIDESTDIAFEKAAPESPGREADAFPETVIISPGRKKPSAPAPFTHDHAETAPFPLKASDASAVSGTVGPSDDFPETVVISPPGGGHPERRTGGTGKAVPPASSPAVEDLAETVVLKKAGGPPPPPPPVRSGEPPREKPRRDDPKKKDDETEDDIIFETVIIRPGSLRGNHKEE